MKLHSGIFYTNNIDTVEAFYIDLGFKVEYRSGDRFISFIIGDNGRLGIKKKTEVREIPGHQTIFIEVSDIENYYNKIKDKGLEILKPLTKEEWATEFTILDPDGNKILFREN
jgi:predicted enzyme related to lactoylglutathione lyase